MDPLLYGHNDEKGVVAVHHLSEDRMRVFKRTEAGVIFSDTEFYPFFFLSDSTLLAGFSRKHWVRELTGKNHFRYLCAFQKWSDMWEAVRCVIDTYNERLKGTVSTWQEVPSLLLRPDPVSQFLLQSGLTLFKGMTFPELHRFQLDIETYSGRGHRFSDPDRPEDRIILIALSDSRGFSEVLDGRKLDEKSMLERLCEVIRERDCDVIEGHNIYNFDLPYILKRCRQHGVEPDIGRHGLKLRKPDGRSVRTERAMELQMLDIPGRHIVDTWVLLQTYDHSKRKLESYSLKHAAKHFGFSRENRVYINPDRISWHWDHDPQPLVEYATDDVDETRLLSEYLSPPYFYLTQMTPFNYGTAARNGSATKIESIILREYIRTRSAVPAPEPTHPTSGGYADVFYTGVLGPVVDIDVESLYPSIMVREQIAPHSETHGIFSRMLESLTGLRLQTKKRMKNASGEEARIKLDALQSSFKILINSFYGYLGYHRGLFNDSIAADRVTTTGQELLRSLITAITEKKGTVIEVDTDGIYFVPPPAVRDISAEEKFVRQVARVLPEGISLALNGRYSSMLSYKVKNYALRGYDGRITLKGSSLTSRSIEKFGRNFIRQCVETILNSDVEGLHRLYVDLYRKISTNALPVGDFARTETLRDSREEYQSAVKEGKRNRSAPYEAALAAYTSWRRGEKVSYYVSGNDPDSQSFANAKLAEEWDPVAPDENVPYYLRRLEEISKKFEPFFTPRDFRLIFSPEDLFGFSGEGMKILTRSVGPGEAGLPEEAEGDAVPREPRIWLDLEE